MPVQSKDLPDDILTELLSPVLDAAKYDPTTATFPWLHDINSEDGNFRLWCMTPRTMWTGQHRTFDEVIELLEFLTSWFLNCFQVPRRCNTSTKACLYHVAKMLSSRLVLPEVSDQPERGRDLSPRELLLFRAWALHTPTTLETLNRYYERTQSLLYSQKAIPDNNRLEKKFEAMLGYFSNLKEVKIYGAPMFPVHHIYNILAGEDDYRVPIESDLQLDTLLDYPWDPTELQVDQFVNAKRSDVAKSTLYMLKALGSTNTSLRSFHFGTFPWSMWLKTADIIYWPDYHPYTTRVMKSLKEFSADFYLLALGNYDPISASVPFQIAKFLNAARSVELIKVDFRDRQYFAETGEKFGPGHDRFRNWNPDNCPDVSQILERVWWPRLKEIRIGGCGLTEHAFLTFMERHSQTLRHLAVEHLRLIVPPIPMQAPRQPSDWRPIIDAIAPRMSLETVELDRLYDEAQEVSIIRFIDSLEDLPESYSVYVDAQGEATSEWRDYSHRVAAYLQSGGSGKYPEWISINDANYRRGDL